MTRYTALLCLGLACGGSQSNPTTQRSAGVPADWIIWGDRDAGWTQVDDVPRAAGVALRGEQIVAVGTCGQLEPLLGPNTKVLALDRGQHFSAGLADAHAHLYGLGAALESVDLRGSQSPAAAAATIAAADGHGWITGRGWDQNLWQPSEFPTAADLDEVAPDRPVAVRRIDGHALWANRRAMELAGIDRETKTPDGGEIVRDAAGIPTGIFIDTAMSLIEDKIPDPDRSTIRRRILEAAKHVAALGLTAVHDMGIGEDVAAVYRELAAQGELPIRVYGLYAYRDGLETELPPVQNENGLFEIRAVKMFADGALGSRGALLLEPYADAPNNAGLTIHSAERIESVGRVLASKGYQLAVHAIGDRANRETLDAFAAVGSAFPERDLRFRVEHAQIVHPADRPRFAELGVIASMQPTHATSDMPWAEQRIGSTRIGGAYAWRSLLDAAATIAFGSDFPVEKPSPLLGIYAATTRQDEAGKPAGGWRPSEKLTLAEALALFTRAPAYAAFAEDERGQLRPGYAADVTVFDGPLAADRSLLERRARLTLVGGRVAHDQTGDAVVTGPESLGCDDR